MAKSSLPAGLDVRLAAISRLQDVLKGAPFAPFDADMLADPRDRALANRLVTTALRRHGHLDVILADVLDRGVPKRSGSFAAALRLGLTELLFLPGQADHSALFLAVEAVKRDKRAAHLAKLMNGVLRRVQRQSAQYAGLPDEKLFPEWLVVRWKERFGEKAVALFGQALLEGAPLDLTLREDDAGLVAALNGVELTGDSIRILTRDRPVADLPGYAEGRWWVQDVSSALPARLMDAEPGGRILDMCAAPGGKTAQLAKAGFKVTALDNDGKRLDRVSDNLKRLGYAADTVVADGTEYVPEGLFDGVLLDAPCSATGTFRRHPEVLWHRRATDIADRAGLQRKLLTNAVNCLNDDGVLVYSTCSLEREEGEDQALWLLKSMPQMENFPIRAGEADGLGGAIDDNGWLRLHPGLAAPGATKGAMDGFFVARFRKRRVQG